MTTARLFLSGIRATGRHGARPGEKDEPQDFVVDLDIEVNVGDDDIDGHRRLSRHHGGDPCDRGAGIVRPDRVDGRRDRGRPVDARPRGAGHRRRPQAERCRGGWASTASPPRPPPPPVAGRWRPSSGWARTSATGSRTLQHAIDLLAAEPGISVRRTSRVWETDPVGGPQQPDFLNVVAEIDTTLEPLDLLAAVNRVEAALGRTRDVRWGPRTIDIDILLIDDRTIDDDRPDRPPPPHAPESLRRHAPPRTAPRPGPPRRHPPPRDAPPRPTRSPRVPTAELSIR